MSTSEDIYNLQKSPCEIIHGFVGVHEITLMQWILESESLERSSLER